MSPEEADVALEIAGMRRRAAVRRGAWSRAYELAAWADRVLDQRRGKPPLTRAMLRGGTESPRQTHRE